MKIQIEATSDIVKIGDVECRRWEGVTESGVECEVFVHRLAVHESQDSTQFEAELVEKMPPSIPNAIKLGHVL